MLGVYAAAADADRPLDGLVVGHLDLIQPERPAPPTISAADSADQANSADDCGSGTVTLAVRAATLNAHDLWTLRGAVRPRHGLPSVLGTDAAGVTADGRGYLVHAVLGNAARGGGDETLDPDRAVLSDAGYGTLREEITVPSANLVPKPDALSFAEAACLPTAWLTAYRMLFTKAAARPGDRVLVQGAGGGVATAALLLGKAAGLEVQVTSRSAERRHRALGLGADAVFGPDDRIPGGVDVVVDTVGAATWAASIRAARPGGTVVLCGATSGFRAPTDLARVFSRQLRILGSTMGTRDELAALVRFLLITGVRPLIDSIRPLSAAADQFARLEAGHFFGKLVVEP